MYVPECNYVHHRHAVPIGARGTPGTGITDCCELPCGCREPNPVLRRAASALDG